MMKTSGPAAGRILCLLFCMGASVAGAFGFSFGQKSHEPRHANGSFSGVGPAPNAAANTVHPQHTFSYSVRRRSTPDGYSVNISSMRNGDPAQTQSYSFSSNPAGNQTPLQSYRPPTEPVHIPYLNDLPKMPQFPMAAPRPGQYPMAATGSGSPGVETHISEDSAFVDQPVIYTVRVVSQSHIKTLDVVIPQTDSVAVEQLEGPVTRSRMRVGGMPESVNEYRFALTPIKAGDISVPPIQVKGTFATSQPWYSAPPFNNDNGGGKGKTFRVSSGEPIKLKVKPADSSVQPWLPLESLQIKGQLESSGVIEAGQPVSLTITLTGTGLAGDQLPSIESQLKSNDYRVYRESSRTERELAGDKGALVGSRTETYTLVPMQGGDLPLPVLRVAWWNTGAGMAETSTLSLDALKVTGSVESTSSRSAGVAQSQLQPQPIAAFWIPLAVFLGAMFGYWSWAWMRSRVAGKTGLAVRKKLYPVFNRLKTPFERLKVSFERLRSMVKPFNLRQNLRYRLVMIMPPSMKLWFCSRCIQDENNPTEWCQMFKFLACKHLEIPHQTPLAEVGDRIVDVHRGTQPEQVREMLQDLDGAMYGGKPVDFEDWKKAFRHELRPRLFRRKRKDATASGELPALNP